MMRVPIFPLNLVLFPGQILPLHIFEERYKQMLQRCLREHLPFGIVLIRESGRGGRGTPHSIGTFAQVTQVNEIPEGQCTVPAPHRGNCYHIICRGTDRFRISALDRREAEYLVADVDPFPDERAPAPAMAMVAQRVAVLFDDYYRQVVALMGGWQREAEANDRTLMLDMSALVNGQARLQAGEPMTDEQKARSRVITVPTLPEAPGALANIVAAELNVPPQAKQDLLETASALARLQREAEILAEETPQLQERLQLQHRRRFSAFGMSN